MKQLFIITFISTLIVFSTSAKASDKVVRVLIDENLKSVKFFSIYPVRLQVAEGDVLDLNVGKSEVTVTQKKDKWKVIVSALSKKNIHYVIAPQIKIYSRSLNWENKAVDFPVTLLSQGPNMMMVGSMAMNRYLNGVVPHEMPQSWPLEALKAQAVASRTYALWKMGNATATNYDLKPSVADQVFRMEDYGTAGNYHPNVQKALTQTEGSFLVDSKSYLVKAYFHSDCGGDTDSAESVWGAKNISTSSVRDIACSQRKSLWTSDWTVERLKQKVMASYFLPNGVELVDVIVRHQLKSQRVEFVDLIFSKGIFKRLRGEDLRRVLGYDKIKSTLFEVQKQGSEVVFSGRGNGHGVGMCQWGARSMAASGKSFKNILAHYYPGVTLWSPPQISPPADSQSVSAL